MWGFAVVHWEPFRKQESERKAVGGGGGGGATCKGRRRHVQLHLPGGTWETTKHSIFSSVHLT